MNKLALSIAALFAAVHVHAALPGELPLPNAETLGKQCDGSIADARQAVARLEQLPLHKVNPRTTLGAWNKINLSLGDMSGLVGLLAETSPDAAVRKAAEDCDLKISALNNEYLQSEALYARFKALKPADGIDAEARTDLLTDFEDRGVNLPADKRKQMSDIFNRIDKLQQDFARNLRDNKVTMSFAPDELQGVSASFLATARRDEQGRYVIGFDYPEIDAVLSYADKEDTRRRYYIQRTRIGSEENLAILKQVVELRKQLATLAGYPDYASWALRSKMVGKPEVVNGFLNEVQAKVTDIEKHELEALRQEKIQHTGVADATFNRWDLAYYEARLKHTRYSLDQQKVREQFPTEPTIAWMMKVTSTLYGVEFKPNHDLPTWQADVRPYDVYDVRTHQYLSSFYLDLFPRAGKYKHAAAFPVRAVSTREGRTPVSVLVTNFSREGFNQDELETLFHEFGHVMHGVLSRTRYSMQAGTAVKRDFVEAPSQMYEEWPRRPEAEKLFSETCPTCKPIDPQLIQRMNESRLFGLGIQYARQRLYAAYDMALAGDKPGDPMQVWSDMEGNTPLGHVPTTEFPGTFGHIVGGYAAGYYGYMWSQVLALDMLSAYGDNVMNLDQGRRYRQIILENGGQVPPMVLVEQFIGRKPNPEAFFREITGQRGGGTNSAVAAPAARKN